MGRGKTVGQSSIMGCIICPWLSGVIISLHWLFKKVWRQLNLRREGKAEPLGMTNKSKEKRKRRSKMELRKPGFFVLAVAMVMVIMVSGGPAFAGQTMSDEAGTSGACDLSVVFETRQAIATIGALDWESFEIDGETYLAVANYHNDSSYNVNSRIYKWDGTSFVEFQAVPTNGAYDWESFEIGGETYLAVANYYNGSTRNIDSRIYKWDGTSFVEFQAVATNGAIDWESFEIEGETYLAVANNYNNSTRNIDSRIYKWDGTLFVEFQAVATNGAYDWESFEIGGETYLAVANYSNDSTRNINSRIYKAMKRTRVSGIISNEIWTQECSPYCVAGDIFVASLTIEPGVMVKFLGNYVFEVAGVLTATGTGQDPIIFTKADTNKSWQGIFFNYSSPGSELAYCTIERSINSGIRIDNSVPLITCCTIRNNSAYRGGGIKVELTSLSSGELIITDSIITDNTSSNHGGGMRVDLQTASLTLQGCEISNNHSNPAHATGNYVGGGMYATVNGEGNLLLSGCEIIVNTSDSRCYGWNCNVTGRGGGIYFNGASSNPVSIENCIIKDNLAYTQEHNVGGSEHSYSYGGGIYNYSGDLKITNSVVWSNNATAYGSYSYAYGGGIYLNAGTLTLTNCTVTENSANASGYDHTCHAYGGGLRNGSGTLTVTNSIVFYNAKNLNGTISYSQIDGTATVTYSDVQDGYDGEGNINVHPILGSCLQILPGSLCTDAGDPDPQYNDVCFPPSLGAVRNDMGAHGGPGACQWEYCNGDFDCDLDIDGSDLSVFAADFGRTDCNNDCNGDFDGDDDVDGSDLAVFAANFGQTDCCPK